MKGITMDIDFALKAQQAEIERRLAEARAKALALPLTWLPFADLARLLEGDK